MGVFVLFGVGLGIVFPKLGEFAGVELVDDVDGLGGDSEGGHELVEGDEVLFWQACSGYEYVELDAEEDFIFEGEGLGEV